MTTESTTGGAAPAGAGDPPGDTSTESQAAGQQPPAGQSAQSDSDASKGQQGTAPEAGAANDAQDDSATLGEGGQKALRAEREARKAAEARARQTQQQLDELRREQMSDTERKLHDARVEGAQAGARMLARGAVIEAATRKGFADAEDAVVALDGKLGDYVDLDTEQVDHDAIAADLSALLERKPHWKAAEKAPTPGGADHTDNGGASGLSEVEQWNQSLRQQAAAG